MHFWQFFTERAVVCEIVVTEAHTGTIHARNQISNTPKVGGDLTEKQTETGRRKMENFSFLMLTQMLNMGTGTQN